MPKLLRWKGGLDSVLHVCWLSPAAMGARGSHGAASAASCGWAEVLLLGRCALLFVAGAASALLSVWAAVLLLVGCALLSMGAAVLLLAGPWAGAAVVGGCAVGAGAVDAGAVLWAGRTVLGVV